MAKPWLGGYAGPRRYLSTEHADEHFSSTDKAELPTRDRIGADDPMNVYSASIGGACE
jgi:hypothetical protein